jgi:hypothetical protein
MMPRQKKTGELTLSCDDILLFVVIFFLAHTARNGIEKSRNTRDSGDYYKDTEHALTHDGKACYHVFRRQGKTLFCKKIDYCIHFKKLLSVYQSGITPEAAMLRIIPPAITDAI